jgi:CheY-like chemotaxis protein
MGAMDCDETNVTIVGLFFAKSRLDSITIGPLFSAMKTWALLLASMTIDEDLLNRKQRGGTAILVAETEAVARGSLSDLFREEGYQVLEAPRSAPAIDHINTTAGLRVILTDLDMPGWHSIVRHARMVVPNAFILCMVRPLSIHDVTEAQRLGAHGHFVKPLDFDILHRSIQKLLSGKPSR